MQPTYRPASLNATASGADRTERVRVRIAGCRALLEGFYLRPTEIEHMLRYPPRYWRPVQNKQEKPCHSPNRLLREAQEKALVWARNCWFSAVPERFRTPLPYFPATAFIRRSSIIENARYHADNRSSWQLDLRNAFEQIRTKHIQRSFIRWGMSLDAAWVFSRLLTFRGRLRRGAPSSPAIFNLLLERLDLELTRALGAPTKPELLKHRQEPGPVYTRYGDNLCFSSPDVIFSEAAKHRILEIIASHGFRLNHRKTREGRNGVLEFPGVVVANGFIRPNSRYFSRLKAAAASGSFGSDGIREGHYGFLRQFPQARRLKIVRTLLNSSTASPPPK